MRKNRHDRVIEILYNLAKNYIGYYKVFADHISENYMKIDILSSPKRRETIVHSYYPDLWCKRKTTSRIHIFEVWDNQSEEACVEDILFAALTPNIEYLSIICFEKDQYDLALKLVKVILSSLFNDEGKLLLDPSSVLRYVKLIPNDVINDNNKLKKFLHDELDF